MTTSQIVAPFINDIIHIGDTGTVFEFQIIEEGKVIVLPGTIAGSKILFKRPDFSEYMRDLVIIDQANAVVGYTTGPNDLDQVGYWIIQLDLDLAGWFGYSNTVGFQVRNVLTGS